MARISVASICVCGMLSGVALGGVGSTGGGLSTLRCRRSHCVHPPIFFSSGDQALFSAGRVHSYFPSHPSSSIHDLFPLRFPVSSHCGHLGGRGSKVCGHFCQLICAPIHRVCNDFASQKESATLGCCCYLPHYFDHGRCCQHAGSNRIWVPVANASSRQCGSTSSNGTPLVQVCCLDCWCNSAAMSSATDSGFLDDIGNRHTCGHWRQSFSSIFARQIPKRGDRETA
mmetsp:Transcript_124662/g.248836  ORF Transcript_124662/g.248836 Transcript_124662/m.248836 type:complete len:228 (+) Transcript_124662:581-1264(+)